MSGESALVWFLVVLVVAVSSQAEAGRPSRGVSGEAEDGFIVMPTDGDGSSVDDGDDADAAGTRWAILIAGSAGYGNYRHQADVCHAYQVLRRRGLKDDNIVVFMYDDIADNDYNPRPGEIINSPLGLDVYAGVPKDYTGSNVTVSNFFAVLLGNKTEVTGGSGKVVDSGPDDHIFIFYSDHGGPGVLGMPTNPNLYANDFVEALQKKHDAAGYKEMVIYVEACESGSIFEGLLPENLNIYVTTASNAEESSWGTYCPGMDPSPPPEYFTCLGDLYSVAWMEDSEVHNLEEETLTEQYSTVKTRTSNHNTYVSGSHVMQYGDHNISAENINVYMGSGPAMENTTFFDGGTVLSVPLHYPAGLRYFHEGKKVEGVHQRDADLLFLWHKFNMGDEGSNEKLEAQQELVEEMSYRMHLDKSVSLIGKIIFGDEEGPVALTAARPQGERLVDDWLCLKSLVRTFESHCGSLTDYGMRHMRAFANICNAGIKPNTFSEASRKVCTMSKMSQVFSPLKLGFSA